jgi:hypothetical protein
MYQYFIDTANVLSTDNGEEQGVFLRVAWEEGNVRFL